MSRKVMSRERGMEDCRWKAGIDKVRRIMVECFPRLVYPDFKLTSDYGTAMFPLFCIDHLTFSNEKPAYPAYPLRDVLHYPY